MKKIHFIAAILTTALVIASCNAQKTGTWSELKGEWNVLSIDGTEVSTVGNVHKTPFIGFREDGKIYGSTGCNLLIGSVETPDDPTVIDLSTLGTTMMVCPDMSLEERFLGAVRQVIRYRETGENTLEFLDRENRTRMVLEKR